MTGFCKQFDFPSIDDIIALGALYRRAMMDLIPDYIKRKGPGQDQMSIRCSRKSARIRMA